MVRKIQTDGTEKKEKEEMIIFNNYKAKTAATGQWVIGQKTMEKDGKTFLLTSVCVDGWVNLKWAEILPETLCERTSCVDKAYSFMYENDVVVNSEHHWAGVIKWDENIQEYRICVYLPDGVPLPESVEETTTINWEIIGNLHDNPDALSDFYKGLEE